MKRILEPLLYFCIISIIIGPLGALPLQIPNINLHLTDIFVGLTCIVWIANTQRFINIIRKDKISLFFFLFFFVAFLSFIFSPISLTFQERVISGLYLIRYLAYFFVYITVLYLTKKKSSSKKNIFQILSFIGVTLALLGWIQYFLYPDLRNLSYLGWDPHYKRIFGVFLDPNFLGLILVLSLIVLFFLQTNLLVFLIRIFIFITLMFTYSRSSFVSLAAAAIFYSSFKKRYLLLGTALLVLSISIILLPRPYGEGVKLERSFSIEKRIENWKEGANIFLKHPILGVGFNTIRYAKIQYGFSLKEDLLISHSGAGFENSFIFVTATSGAIGLFFYILLLVKIYQNVDLIGRMSLVAIVVHSLFLNSLFFPWVMLWLWVIVAINRLIIDQGV